MAEATHTHTESNETMQAMKANNMEDRGSQALKTHMNNCSKMDIRQTRRGCLQEILGCEATTEFKYFVNGNEVFHSVEEASFCCRLCCAPSHPFKMTVKELGTEAELVSVDRPFRCASGGCKCCCYQQAFVTSGGNKLGNIKENCFFCVPAFTVRDGDNSPIYTVHPPTCIGGMCVNCCAEGNPCGRGCCKESFRVFPYDQSSTNGDAPYIGRILKKPKSLGVELFTDADAFEVDFPENATADQKGLLIGTSILLNAAFYEGQSTQAELG